MTSMQGRRYGVDWGGHVHPTFARDHSRDWCRSSEFFCGGGELGVANVHVQQLPMFLFAVLPPFTCLLFTIHHYFLAYWWVSKYQTKVAYFAPRLDGPTAECFQLQGGLRPLIPVIGSHSALAMSPTHAFCTTPLFSTWRRPC